LGVDGGGTKTEAWLARFDSDGEPIVLGRGNAGSSNPRAVGLDAALTNLGASIDAAWSDAGLQREQVECVVLAISGAGHESVRQQIAAWAKARGLARQLRFEHDAEPVLAEGTPEGRGIALIVGTGSAAIGVSSDGEKQVVGGWGYHFGDEGSAYWIGRRALEAVARASDGRGSPTHLTAAVLERLGADDTRAILGALEKSGNVRGAIAALADAVDTAAKDGDAAAVAIVDEAVAELAHMVATLADRLALGREFPLALAGGVACGSEMLRDRLLGELNRRSLSPRPLRTVPHPVAGCLRLAWQDVPKK
jgi:N-acetylglucosamine kinase-like BadF-type ATPase